MTQSFEEDNETTAAIYYLLGRNYYELGDYSKAAQAYKKANHSHEDGIYYVEYAISLARNNETEKALDALEQAKELNAQKDYVLLTQGEILFAKGETEKALDTFQACVNESSDKHVVFRAYLAINEIYELSPKDEKICQENVAVMSKALQSLPAEYRPILLEKQAQAYIKVAALNGQSEDYEAAIEVLREIVNSGWATFSTYSNLVVLYQKKGELDNMYEQLVEGNWIKGEENIESY